MPPIMSTFFFSLAVTLYSAGIAWAASQAGRAGVWVAAMLATTLAAACAGMAAVKAGWVVL